MRDCDRVYIHTYIPIHIHIHVSYTVKVDRRITNTMGDESAKFIICGRSAHKTASVQVEQDWIRTGVIRLRIGVHVQVQTVFYSTTIVAWRLDI